MGSLEYQDVFQPYYEGRDSELIDDKASVALEVKPVAATGVRARRAARLAPEAVIRTAGRRD